MVIREEAQRRRLAAVYRKASDEVAEIYAARGRPAHLTDAQYQRLMAGGSYLWDHIGDAPMLLAPCLKKRDNHRPYSYKRLGQFSQLWDGGSPRSRHGRRGIRGGDRFPSRDDFPVPVDDVAQRKSRLCPTYRWPQTTVSLGRGGA
jgi:hypothetical protein